MKIINKIILVVFFLIALPVAFMLTGCDSSKNEDVPPIKINYTINFVSSDLNYGSIDISSISVEEGSELIVNDDKILINDYVITAVPTQSDSRYEYSFEGWSIDSSVINEDLVVTANFKRTVVGYLVRFSSNDLEYGSTNISSLIVPKSIEASMEIEGNKITLNGQSILATSLNSDWYEFVSWDYNLTTITEDTNIKAIFQIKPEIKDVSEYTKLSFDCRRNSIYQNGVYNIEYTAQVYKSNQTVGAVQIPSVVKKYNSSVYGYRVYPVKSIKAEGFRDCLELTSITIPNNIIEVGDGAFSGCSNLMSMSLPFTGKSATFEGVSYEETAFGYIFGKTEFTGSIEINQNSCKFYIPQSLTSVIFTGEKVLDYAFSGCLNLQTINLSENVKNIGRYAFLDCKNLQNINISEQVLSLSDGVFYGCSNLVSILLPNSLENIEEDVFNGCLKLTLVALPNTIMNIGARAFKNSGLTTFTMPQSLEEISSQLFYQCSDLEDVDLGDNIIKIGAEAFYGCSKLTSVSMPKTIIEISNRAFLDCNALEKVEIEDVDSWCSVDLFDCYSNPLYYAEHLYKNGIEITSLNISETVSEIKDYVFYNCLDIKSISLPYNLNRIGNYAFYNCINLSRIIIPQNVTSIGSGAFRNCKNLQSVGVCSQEIFINLYGNNSYGGLLANALVVYIKNSLSIPADSKIFGNFYRQSTSDWEGYYMFCL